MAIINPYTQSRPAPYTTKKKKLEVVNLNTATPEQKAEYDRLRGIPEIVNLKERFGDWETDSMLFSKQKPILSVQHERKSLLCRIQKVPDKSAEETEMAIQKAIETLPPECWKTITRDNGTENVRHEDTREIFGVQSYFCDGYASWQKGGVENTNKLLRQYLPRNTDLSKLDGEDIFAIQERLNNRPRKSLDYLTPNETEIIVDPTLSGAFKP